MSQEVCFDNENSCLHRLLSPELPQKGEDIVTPAVPDDQETFLSSYVEIEHHDT